VEPQTGADIKKEIKGQRKMHIGNMV